MKVSVAEEHQEQWRVPAAYQEAVAAEQEGVTSHQETIVEMLQNGTEVGSAAQI